jgi:hypothetical protein
MKNKITIEEEIHKFFELWDADQLVAFLRDVIPLFELYDLQDEQDWVEKEVGIDNVRNVRLIRMVYLVSRIAEYHAGRLCRVRAEHKDLWKRMQKEVAT